MRRDRHKKQRGVAFGALGVLLLALGSVAAIAPWNAPPIDPNTFCPKDGIHARTAILFDATDPMDEQTIERVRTHAETLVRERLELYEWAGVFVLGEDNLALPTPSIALCNPGNESTCNPLVVNCQDVAREFERKFERPMREAIESLAKLPAGQRSPILEMIRSVALARHFEGAERKRLVVVSDMLQNVPGQYSHYDGNNDFARWSDGDYAREFLRPILNGVEVEIWYIKRPELRGLQTRGHVDFWESYFAAAGARVKKVVPL